MCGYLQLVTALEGVDRGDFCGKQTAEYHGVWLG